MVIAEDSIRGFDQDAIDSFYADHEGSEDEELGLDEERFRNRIADVKALLSRMQESNDCITTFARTYGAFYTLQPEVEVLGVQMDG